MGTRSADGQIKLTLAGNIYNVGPSSRAQAPVGSQILKLTLEDGIEASQFNRAWQSDRSLSSGGSETLDLYDLGAEDIGAGAGKDILGQTLTFEEIVCLVIVQTAGPGRLEINATPPANVIPWIGTHTVANGSALRNGGCRMWLEIDADALDITDGAEHQVQFHANGGDVEFSVYAWGRHDDDESSSSSSSASSQSSASSGSSSSSSLSSQSSASSLSSSSSSSP